MPKFFDRYINQVPDDTTLLDGLQDTKDDFEEVRELLEANQDYRYAEEKWTPKQILQHVIDNERIQSYRALVFARKDQNILPGYDEQLYAREDNSNLRAISDLLYEFKLVRESSILLFEYFSPEMFHRKGVCFNLEVTPLALGFQIIGHGMHHLKVLKERYFVKLD